MSIVLALDLGVASSLLLAGTRAGVWASAGQSQFVQQLHVLDVGQGDAILLSSSQGHHVLVDGGPGTAVLTELPRVLPYFFSDIDLLVLTHPHADHIEGLIPLLKRLEIGAVLMTLPDYPSPAYEAFLENLDGIPIYLAESGTDFRLGDLTLDVLYPFEPISGGKMSNVNNASVVIRAEFPVADERGDHAFVLLMGDAEEEVEAELLAWAGESNYSDSDAGAQLQADVLKAGHHGSRTSSTRAFLEAVQPKLMLISAGDGNDYGHPHPETLANAADLGIKVLRTDRYGTISLIFRSNVPELFYPLRVRLSGAHGKAARDILGHAW